MSLFRRRQESKQERAEVELRLSRAEQIARNHAVRLQRLEAEVQLLQRPAKGRPRLT